MHKTKTIAFAINKGGVGKSTSAACIAQALAMSGYHILFIDMDGQCNSTRLFGAQDKVGGVNHRQLLLYDLEKEEIAGMVKESNFDGISIIPGTEDLQTMDGPLFMACVQYGEKEVTLNFHSNLDRISDEFDYIIIDTSPSVGGLNRCILAAADEVISPISTSTFDMDAMNNEMQLVRTVNNICGTEVRYRGVFITRTSKNNLSREFRELLRSQLGNYYIDVPIRACVKVQESNTYLVPLYKYAPRCSSAVDYIKLVILLGLCDEGHIHILQSRYEKLYKDAVQGGN